MSEWRWKSQRANPKRERSGDSEVFPAIKTASDEVSHEIKTRHSMKFRSYGELGLGWPQGWVPLRFPDQLSKTRTQSALQTRTQSGKAGQAPRAILVVNSSIENSKLSSKLWKQHKRLAVAHTALRIRSRIVAVTYCCATWIHFILCLVGVVRLEKITRRSGCVLCLPHSIMDYHWKSLLFPEF